MNKQDVNKNRSHMTVIQIIAQHVGVKEEDVIRIEGNFLFIHMPTGQPDKVAFISADKKSFTLFTHDDTVAII